MKKQNKILEEIYTVRTITAFSLFCVLFVALLFALKLDELTLYMASDYILPIFSVIAVLGAVLWVLGKIKKGALRAYTLAFIGQLVFFGALPVVLFALLMKDVPDKNDVFSALLAYGILCVVLYTVYASSRESFSHALSSGMGIALIYVLRHFQGGRKFFPILIAANVIFVAYLVFSILRKRKQKSELFAIGAATLFNVAATVIFALEPPLFFYIIGGQAALYIVTRLFVKLQ